MVALWNRADHYNFILWFLLLLLLYGRLYALPLTTSMNCTNKALIVEYYIDTVIKVKGKGFPILDTERWARS